MSVGPLAMYLSKVLIPEARVGRFVMALVATLAYPLHLLITPPSAVVAGGAGTGQAKSERCSPGWQRWQLSSSSSLLPLLSALVVVSTALPIWALAVWGSVNLDWGLASGLSVGLLSACLSLKNASFAHSWCCFNAPETAAKEAAAVASPGGGETRPREEGCGDSDRVGRPLLSFGEFLFFILAAPSLVRVNRERLVLVSWCLLSIAWDTVYPFTQRSCGSPLWCQKGWDRTPTLV